MASASRQRSSGPRQRRASAPAARTRKPSREQPVGWFVYLLRCGDGSLYTGIARDVQARLGQHLSGRGARYTRGRGPLTLLHVEPATSRGEAQRREAAIRRLGREAKEALASGAPQTAD